MPLWEPSIGLTADAADSETGQEDPIKRQAREDAVLALLGSDPWAMWSEDHCIQPGRVVKEGRGGETLNSAMRPEGGLGSSMGFILTCEKR